MKKITFLISIFVVSFTGFAQDPAVTIYDGEGVGNTLPISCQATFLFSDCTSEVISDNANKSGANVSDNSMTFDYPTGVTTSTPNYGAFNVYFRIDVSSLNLNAANNGGIVRFNLRALTNPNLLNGNGTQINARLRIDDNGTNVDANGSGTFTAADGEWQTMTISTGTSAVAANGGNYKYLDILVVLKDNSSPRQDQDFDANTFQVDDVEIAATEAILSTSDFKNEEFASYNTANSFELNTDQKISSVRVYNISGQVVATKTTGDNSVSVSTNGLSSGIYLVEATTVNGTKGLFKIAK